jgi:uncharacterized membrane protein
MGVFGTFVQTLEKIRILERPGEALWCDRGSALSCTSVLKAWQSSALGVPNSMVGVVVFGFFLTAGVALVLRSRPSVAFLGVVQFFALFMLGFTLWYLWQTTFVLGSLCVYCILNGTAVVVANLAAPRLLVGAGRLQGDGVVGFVRRAVQDGVDAWFWLALWAGVAVTMWAVLS